MHQRLAHGPRMEPPSAAGVPSRFDFSTLALPRSRGTLSNVLSIPVGLIIRQVSFKNGAFARSPPAGCSVLQAGGQAFAAVLNSNDVSS